MVAKGAPQAIVALAKPAADVADKVKQTVASWPARVTARSASPVREDDGRPGRCSASCRCSIRRATIPRPPSTPSGQGRAGQDDHRRRHRHRHRDRAPARPRHQHHPAAEFFPKDMDPDNVPAAIADAIETADGFARVFPEHKYAIVKALQGRGHLVAMTGDGVNDAPALKQADCGTACRGATDAARGAAALILTAPGLSVINSAIDEARRIFGRITSYTIYRVALTLNIMFLVMLSTIFFDFTAAHRDHDRHHVPARRPADHGHRLRQHAVAAQPIRWRMPGVLGISSVLGLRLDRADHWPAADRHGDAERPAGAGPVRPCDAGRAADGDVPPDGGRRPSAAVRHADRRWFFLRPFPAAPLVWAICLPPGSLAVLMCALRLAGAAAALGRRSAGSGPTTCRLDVRARRRQA